VFQKPIWAISRMRRTKKMKRMEVGSEVASEM
jgi:hypothetical protein